MMDVSHVPQVGEVDIGPYTSKIGPYEYPGRSPT